MSAAFGSAGDRPFTAYTCSPFHSRACGRAEPSPRLPARNPQAAGPVGSARKVCLSNPPGEPKQTCAEPAGSAGPWRRARRL